MAGKSIACWGLKIWFWIDDDYVPQSNDANVPQAKIIVPQAQILDLFVMLYKTEQFVNISYFPSLPAILLLSEKQSQLKLSAQYSKFCILFNKLNSKFDFWNFREFSYIKRPFYWKWDVQPMSFWYFISTFVNSLKNIYT